MSPRFLAVIASVLLLAVGIGSAVAGRAFPIDVDAAATGRAVNALRGQSGLPPVGQSGALTRLAEQHAAAMAAAENLSHSVGGSFSSRLSRGGYRAGAAAENIALGPGNLAGAMQTWQQSSAHRANLLDRSVTEFGIGAARDERGRFYWAIILAAPR